MNGSPGLEDLILPDGVLYDVHAANKRQLLGTLSAHAARLTGHDESHILDIVLERERLGSTGFGSGTAIPHGKLGQLNRVSVVFAKLATPVDFDALDAQPVDLVALMLAPLGAGADHLKALARISRALRDRALVAKLRGSASADALGALLTGDPQSRAA